MNAEGHTLKGGIGNGPAPAVCVGASIWTGVKRRPNADRPCRWEVVK